MYQEKLKDQQTPDPENYIQLEREHKEVTIGKELLTRK